MHFRQIKGNKWSSSVPVVFMLCILFNVANVHLALAAAKVPHSQLNAPSQLASAINATHILGIGGYPGETYSYITWRRVAHPSCGSSDLRGDKLRNAIQNYHAHGIRILLTVCQPPNTSRNPYDQAPLRDAAQGRPDAVQCGNEEMKKGDPSVNFLYMPPQAFAKFYDLCERAIHAVSPGIPVLLGSLDPHVGGIDYGPLQSQVYYLNQMQHAMNTSVHPGGNWNWHTQTLGLIDSWHNGFPSTSVNSLYHLFLFWAKQFGVSLSGGLEKHLWVVEGTGCFKGCGLDSSNPHLIAVVHVLALITDVVTTTTYGIPFFFFGGRDFLLNGTYWPIGVLDLNGHPKPLRQDLALGARVLRMNCSSRRTDVVDQEDLLARLYEGCTLPSNYISVLKS